MTDKRRGLGLCGRSRIYLLDEMRCFSLSLSGWWGGKKGKWEVVEYVCDLMVIMWAGRR